MGYSWGALAGAFLGPFFWALYSGKISKASVWCSFIFGVGLTVVNMTMGFVGTPLIDSPINCGAICMVASLIIVPVVSLFTPKVPFDISKPSALGSVDREFIEEVEREQQMVQDLESVETSQQYEAGFSDDQEAGPRGPNKYY